MQIAVGKICVGKPVTEGIRHRHFGRLVIAVTDVQAFAVLHIAAVLAEILVAGVVLTVQGPGFGQFAAGVDLAGKHIQHRPCAGLARKPGPDKALAVAGPGGFNSGAAAQHNHNMGVGPVYGQQQINLVLGQFHIGPVKSFALFDFVEPQEQQHHVCLAGQGDGLGLQGGVGLAAAVKPLGIAGAVQAAALEHFGKAVHTGRVDQAGPGALVPRGLGKVADDRHLGGGVQRQDAAAVFQQNHAFGRGFAGQGVMGVPINGSGGIFQRGGGGFDQGEQFFQPGVDIHFADAAVLDSLDQFPHRIKPRGGHFKR